MSDVFHTYVVQQCWGTGKFIGHTHTHTHTHIHTHIHTHTYTHAYTHTHTHTHTTCFSRTGYETKHSSVIWHKTLQERTANSILEFQIGLRLKTVFSNKNSLRFWKDVSVDSRFYSHCWGFVSSRDLCLLLTQPLHIHTNISHSFIARTECHTSDCANFQSPCIIVFFISSPRHTYLLPTNGIIWSNSKNNGNKAFFFQTIPNRTCIHLSVRNLLVFDFEKLFRRIPGCKVLIKD